MSGDSPIIDGELVERGEFRIDERRAREKLRNYRLPSPHHYILEFVKVANLLGATFFEATVGRSEVIVEFDGQLLGREQFEELYSAAFGSGRSRRQRALRHLAVGINAAWGAGLRDLVIDVGGDEPFAIAVGDDSMGGAKIAGSIPEGIRIRLQKRLHQAVLLRFIDQLGGDFKESRLLSERARYSTTDIVINGVSISQGLTPRDDIQALHRFRSDGERGVVGLTRNGYGAVIRLVEQGVLIDDDAQESPFAPFGIRALVESEHFDTDLSQSAVVENDALAELRRRVEAVAHRSLAGVLSELSADDVAGERRALRAVVVRVLAGTEVPHSTTEEFRDLTEVLSELPVFECASTADGEPSYISIDDACVERDGETVVHFSTQSSLPEPGPESSTPVLWLDPSESAYDVVPGYTLIYGFLDHYGDRFRDVADVARRRRRVRKNRRQWQSRPPFELDARDVLRERVESIVVAVGRAGDDSIHLSPGTALTTEVSFVKEGRLLTQRLLDSEIGAFRIAIDGELPVDADFEQPLYADSTVRAASMTALKLVAQHLQESRLTPNIFCSLLGDIQAELNGAFHLDWDDWSDDVIESPLGVAPALVRRNKPEGRQAQVQLRLRRLGGLADDPILDVMDGRRRSLRQIYEQLYTVEAECGLYIVERQYRGERPVGAQAEDIVIVAGEHVAAVVTHFFGAPSAGGDAHIDDTVDVVDHWCDNTASADTGPRRPEGSGDVGELHSRLAKVEHLGDRGAEDTHRSTPEAPHRPGDSTSGAADDGASPVLCKRLLDDLHQCSPDEFRRRVESIDELAVIERCGDDAVYVLGDGNRVVLDAAHPVIGQALRRPDDPVARAFAASAIFQQLLEFDIEHGRHSSSTLKQLTMVRTFLEACTSGLL